MNKLEFKSGKLVKKTKLQINLTSDTVSFNLYERKAKTEEASERSAFVNLSQYQNEKRKISESVSSFGNAFAFEKSAFVTSNALKKVFIRSGNPFMYRLWQESKHAFGFFSVSNYNNTEFKKSLLAKARKRKRLMKAFFETSDNTVKSVIASELARTRLSATEKARLSIIACNARNNNNESVRFYLISDNQKKEVFASDIMKLKKFYHASEEELIQHNFCYITIEQEFNHDLYLASQKHELFKLYHDCKNRIAEARKAEAEATDKEVIEKLARSREADEQMLKYYFFKAEEESVLLYPDIRSKRKRIASVWKESKLSEFGREMKQYKNECDEVILDLQFVAYEAISRLVSAGLLNDYSDLRKYIDYVYSCVNSEIAINRKIAKEEAEAQKDSYLNSDLFEDGSIVNQETIARSFYNGSFQSIEKASVCKDIYRILVNGLEKRSNKDTEMIAKAFILYTYANKTYEEIAKAFGLKSKSAPLKYVKECKELLTSPWGLNQLFKSCLIGELEYNRRLALLGLQAGKHSNFAEFKERLISYSVLRSIAFSESRYTKKQAKAVNCEYEKAVKYWESLAM